MFDTFYISQVGQKSLSSPGAWFTAKRQLRDNIKKIVDYYRNNPLTISSSHLLIRIIYAMNISKSLPLDKYLDYCNQRAYTVAQNLGLTSSTSRGYIWDGIFYGKGSSEVIMANTEYFDISNSETNWKDMQSVRVLHHSKSDLNGNIPDGRWNGTDNDIAIITVNIPMLMLQYYYFTKEQEKIHLEDSRKSIMQFIYSYPLTNMVYSHMDYCIINRLRNKNDLLYSKPPLLKHPFGLPDVYGIVDNSLTIVNDYLISHQLINTYMKGLCIPSITKDNSTEVMNFPNTATTLQMYWSVILSSLNYISYILRTYEDPRRSVGKDVNNIQRLLGMHNVHSTLNGLFGKNPKYAKIMEDYNYIIKL